MVLHIRTKTAPEPVRVTKKSSVQRLVEATDLHLLMYWRQFCSHAFQIFYKNRDNNEETKTKILN